MFIRNILLSSLELCHCNFFVQMSRVFLTLIQLIVYDYFIQINAQYKYLNSIKNVPCVNNLSIKHQSYSKLSKLDAFVQ